jgi:hypothetical protein
METLEKLLFLAEIEPSSPISTLSKSDVGSKASAFIEDWKRRFEKKCKLNPHLVLPVMHSVIGAILREVRIHYDAENVDMRTSLLVIQDSGTGKKPAMEFSEKIVQGVLPDFVVKRRSNLTSAGAVGTLTEAEIIEPTSKTKIKTYIPVYGDLKTTDFLSISEAGSLLETKMDQFGNDLLRNICESQDTDNKISKKLAKGEVPEFTSKTVLSLWTVPPSNINKLVTQTGLIQRFIPVFKTVTLSEYKSLRTEIISSLGQEVDEASNIQPVVDILKNKPLIDKFHFGSDTKKAICSKALVLDGILLDVGAEYVDRLKSFTVRRDLLMAKLAAQHAWLDERSNVEPEDVEYAFKLLEELWISMLDFFKERWNLADTNDKEHIALSILEVAKPVAVNDFYRLLCEQTRCGTATARKIAQVLEGRGYVRRFGEKSNRFIERLK